MNKLTEESCRKILEQNNLNVKEEKLLANGTGVQLCLENGAIICLYNTGTCQVQGKNKVEIESVLFGMGKFEAKSNKIFIVYGHDTTSKTQLEAMLRRWGLDPLFMDQLPSEGQTIIEKLEKYAKDNEVEYSIVLASPDDVGYRRDHEDEKAYRARQNVVLELGMLLATLGRNKVAILLKRSGSMERPSDIQGLMYIPYVDDLQKEAGQILAKEMVKAGFDIKVSNL